MSRDDATTEADAIEACLTGDSRDPLTVQLYDPSVSHAEPCGTVTFHRPHGETQAHMDIRCRPFETRAALQALADKLATAQSGPQWSLYFTGEK